MLLGSDCGQPSTGFEMSSRSAKYSGLQCSALIRKLSVTSPQCVSLWLTAYSIYPVRLVSVGCWCMVIACLTWTLRRSTVHQGDFSDLVSVHFLPSWTMVGMPSTALEGQPSPATLLALAGLYLQLAGKCNKWYFKVCWSYFAILTAQRGRFSVSLHVPSWQDNFSSPNSS